MLALRCSPSYVGPTSVANVGPTSFCSSAQCWSNVGNQKHWPNVGPTVPTSHNQTLANVGPIFLTNLTPAYSLASVGGGHFHTCVHLMYFPVEMYGRPTSFCGLEIDNVPGL